MTEERIYKNGTIYKLYSHINEFYYIGSTHTTTRQRKQQHLRKNTRVNKRVSEWIDDVGGDNIKILPLHTYTDLTSTQLRIFEDDEVKQHLGKEFCLNCNRAYRTEDEKQEYHKQYRKDNREKILEIAKKYRENNPEKVIHYRNTHKEEKAQWDKKRKQEHPEKIKAWGKQWRENNKDHLAVKQKEYRDKNPDKIRSYENNRDKEKRKQQAKESRERNKEKIRERAKKYRENNKEKIAQKKSETNYCIYCNKSITKDKYNRHCQTVSHIKNFILL